jgi:hypothetical protein
MAISVMRRTGLEMPKQGKEFSSARLLAMNHGCEVWRSDGPMEPVISPAPGG